MEALHMAEAIKVTAVVTSYRRQWASVEKALRSILRQTCPVYEILLVDDNNYPDPCSQELRRQAAAWENVTYVPMINNSGVSAARNRAISMAQGDYIAFLDDDDEWCEDKIETEAAIFAAHPEIALAFGTSWIIDDATGKKDHCWQYKNFLPAPTLHDMLAFDRVGSASTPLIRVDALRAVGGFRVKSMPAVEDYELWLRLAEKYPIRGTDKVVFIRHLDDSPHLSRSRKKSFEGFRMIYRLHRAQYQQDRTAHLGILKNVTREGVKARDARVLPYAFKWAALRFLTRG